MLKSVAQPCSAPCSPVRQAGHTMGVLQHSCFLARSAGRTYFKLSWAFASPAAREGGQILACFMHC